MRDTSAIWDYIRAHNEPGSSVVNVPANDPTLIQAQQDGYADWVDGEWIARGVIRIGEQRTIRYSRRAGGTTETRIG